MSYHAGTRLSLHPHKMMFNALPKKSAPSNLPVWQQVWRHKPWNKSDPFKSCKSRNHHSAHYMGIDQTWLTPQKYVKTEDTRNEGHPMFWLNPRRTLQGISESPVGSAPRKIRQHLHLRAPARLHRVFYELRWVMEVPTCQVDRSYRSSGNPMNWYWYLIY